MRFLINYCSYQFQEFPWLKDLIENNIAINVKYAREVFVKIDSKAVQFLATIRAESERGWFLSEQ